MERAVNKLLAGIAYRRDGSFAMAGELNEAIAVGDWTYYLRLPDQLKRVQTQDVHRVAKTYLNEEQSTTGWFIPQAEAAAEAPKTGNRYQENGDISKSPARRPQYYRDPNPPGIGSTGGVRAQQREAGTAAATTFRESSSAPKIAPKVRRRAIAGLDVLTLKTSILDVVTIRGVISAGDVFNPPGNSAIADLTAGMLDKGTVHREKFAVAEILEQAGATLNFGTGTHTLNFSAKCLRKDLPLVIELWAEQLRSPRFDPEEFAKLKKQFVGRHRRNMEDTDFRANGTFARAIFPPGHPNRPPTDEKYLADIEAATLDQLKAYHASHYGPLAARFVAVGDVDDDAIDQALQRALRGWSGGRSWPNATPAPAIRSPRSEKVNMPGKTSVTFVIGQPSGLRHNDPAYQPLHFATSVLGSGFFSARLLDIIRNREGLTYGIGATLHSDTYADGAWSIQGTFAPELLEKGSASTMRELRRFARDGLTGDELKTFKVTLSGSHKVSLATTGGLATALLNALQRGYGPEWLDEFPHRIEALSLEEVNRSIKQFLDPEKMVTVLAGSLPEHSPQKK